MDGHNLYFILQKKEHIVFFLCFWEDTTDFLNLIEKTKVKNRTFVVSMDVTSLFTNIPLNEGIEIVCIAYENFYKVTHLFLAAHYLRETLTLILKVNYFQFIGKQSTYKSTVPRCVQDRSFPFANIFMAYIETHPSSLSKIVFKLTVWKRYIDDIKKLAHF